jgi:hypothetical protein
MKFPQTVAPVVVQSTVAVGQDPAVAMVLHIAGSVHVASTRSWCDWNGGTDASIQVCCALHDSHDGDMMMYGDTCPHRGCRAMRFATQPVQINGIVEVEVDDVEPASCPFVFEPSDFLVSFCREERMK